MVLNHYREAIRSGQSVHWKEESVYPSGRRIAEVAVTPLYDATGVATHLIGIVHDITEHKNAEEALRLSEHKLRLSLQGAHLGTWQYDLNSGRFSVDDAGASKYLECRRVDAAMVAGSDERRVAWSCSPVSYAGEDSVVAWGIDIGAKVGSNVETTASGLHSDLAARERELAAIYENVPGILFYVAVEPDGEFRFLSMSRAGN
jgi:PAS domain-containing protein